MKHMVRNAATAAAVTVSGLIGTAAPAQAYQVDCAILLCLAGGWPASAPCAHARAVFIRRITPWPIEPPLQIWRCPMGISFNAPTPVSPVEQFYDIAFRNEPSISFPEAPFPLVPIQSTEQADIDISSDAFDFVRSIRVFHIEYSQFEGRENCIQSDATRLGTYGVQGNYAWQRSRIANVPSASLVSVPSGCTSYHWRSVFVDWRDHRGNYGFEEVRY